MTRSLALLFSIPALLAAEDPRPDRTLAIAGLAARTAPVYPGSSDSWSRVVPVARIQVSGFRLQNAPMGPGFLMTQSLGGKSTWRTGISVLAMDGRKSSLHQDLSGTQDLAPGAWVGSYAALGDHHSTIEIHVLTGLRREQGTLGLLNLTATPWAHPRYQIQVSAHAIYSDKVHASYNFGRPSTERMTGYGPSFGWSEWSVKTMFILAASHHVSMLAGIQRSRLVGTCRDSPLVSKPDYTSTLFGALYKF